jgi:alpha-amylase
MALKLNSHLTQIPSVFYQIFVRSFSDFNQDGIGDLRGVIHKLDYLAYLGVDGIWLSPIFTSPSYHKYDVVNYYEIDPEYGTMADFEELIEEAQKREIKIILDLVISHTSKEHPWFLEAQSSPENRFRDYYIWKSPKLIKQLRLEQREATADTGIENPWHKASRNTEKYYGIFSHGMPDLNLENLQTRIEILHIARFWMQKGVYGFRLDAAKHIYPAWANPEKNIVFWEALRKELEKDFGQVYLVGEVWAVPDKVAPFFKGLNANFNFELCYDIRDALKLEWDFKGVIKKLLNSYEIYAKENPNFIDATFLGNHDQERIASVFKGNKQKLKAAINLLMTLPGNPFLYYGEELGTEGKKPDKRLREPFIWNYKSNDYFRTDWIKGVYSNEKRLRPLSIQSDDKNSVFSHYRKMIAFRKTHDSLKQISPVNMEDSGIDDPGIISFIRTNPAQNLLVIQNLTKVKRSLEHNFEVKEVLLNTQKSTISNTTATLGSFGLLVVALNSPRIHE